MRYGELIHFEPVEEIIELRRADDREIARHLVETFVISDRLADQLTNLVIPQLQIGAAGDTKGLLVVGNYGTGKSHLMSLMSAIAEHAELAAGLGHSTVADAAKAIAGQFKVVRVEIGAVAMPLRDILCQELERHLADMGVSYSFPSAATITNNKDSFIEMMGEFQQFYPDKGLLLVVDELLDYLRTRKDQELVLDLGFLREIGEVCKSSRFRFMAGVQESLFDNPRFGFVAESVRRVKDRFEQIRIAREDVAYVVAQRLLKKDARQQALIREHLLQFAPLYGSMNERMDEFVRLFPVHPAYLDTFEQVYVAEKREVLKTLTRAIRDLVGKEVPTDQPGLIAYDSYWKNLTDNPSFRAVPEIKEVIDRSSVLEARVQQAFPRPQYKPAALRVIHALSVHRLTTNDIYARIGATAEELRDNLCLLLPGIPEQDPEFLRTMIEKVLKDVISTVSGQFISFNPENGQYHLDLKKDVDFDALIGKRAETLEASELDRYYFDALRQVVLENPAAREHVTGYRIWEHEIEWRERRATRAGYLFFGAPNQRSTAQPPRDFYVYFVQPFDPPYFKDEKRADEVFFRLKHPDEAFERTLKLYAGAREQAVNASGANKKIYEDKATEHLRALTRWLRENMTAAFEVTHAGRSRALSDVIQGKVRPGEADNVRDLVNLAGSLSLAAHFADIAPEYPEFLLLITGENRAQAAQEAMRWIAGSAKSKQGAGVLDALELIDGEQLRPRESRYARDVLDRLAQKGDGQVLNRAELLQNEFGIEYWSPGRFRLEPEFLVVVFAALVHAGEVVLTLPGRKIDAASTDQFTRVPLEELKQFKHVEHPKDLPMAPLQELFDLLGINKGLLVNPATREEAARELVTAATHRVNQVVQAEQHVRSGLTLWGRPILAETEQASWIQRLGETKQFLESLQPYNSAGKLKNFRHDHATVTKQKEGLQLIRDAEELVRLIEHLHPLTAYLQTAEVVLPAGNPWLEQVVAGRTELVGKLTSPKHRADASFQRSTVQELGQLKALYQDVYLDLHGKARLGAGDDKRKGALNTDRRLRQLQKLASVEGMPKQQLVDYQDRLHGLKTCFSLTRQDLDKAPTCPHCGFRPAEEPLLFASATAALDRLDDDLEDMVQDWTRALLADLEDPIVTASIELLGESVGVRAIADIRRTGALPDPVQAEFVKTLQEALSGLEGVPIQQEILYAALMDGGMRCSVADLRARFEAFVQDITRGKDVSKVRIVLE